MLIFAWGHGIAKEVEKLRKEGKRREEMEIVALLYNMGDS